MMAPSGVHLPELWGNPGASSETAWGVGAAAAQPCTDNILPATPCQELACHSTGIAQGAPQKLLACNMTLSAVLFQMDKNLS